MTIEGKLRDALKIIMGINGNDTALIIHDDYARDVATTTKKALEMEGIKVRMYKLPQEKRPLKETPADLRDLIDTMKPTLAYNMFKGSGEETPFRIGLASHETKYGARVGHSPDITMGMIEHPLTADFYTIKENADKLREKFKGVKTVRLTTKLGTDVTFSIEGRAFNDDITISAGEWGNLPSGEMWCAPVENSMNGTIICDGSIGDIGQVKEPLTIIVKNGYVASISSKDSGLVNRVNELFSVDDEAKLCGEFGIGLNPKARLTGILLEDEKAGRTLHIAFGNNHNMPGGKNNSKTHRDFLFKEPSIILDTGEVLMKDGDFKI